MARVHALKISISGVRGVVGDFLTPQLIESFAKAFGTFVGPGRVMVGRDTRTSGEMFLHAVCSGLLSTGCTPVDLGICPTPSVQIRTKETDSVGGIDAEIVTPGDGNGGAVSISLTQVTLEGGSGSNSQFISLGTRLLASIDIPFQ